jgi:signal transduction histidine kinase
LASHTQRPEPQRPDEQLSSLAHELKTPLAVIAGFAELLAVREDERTRREGTAQIIEASRRLASALDDLLEAISAENSDLVGRLADAVAGERRARSEGQSE